MGEHSSDTKTDAGQPRIKIILGMVGSLVVKKQPH